jgi:uncharacterized protein YndB with AHSA1/START domain
VGQHDRFKARTAPALRAVTRYDAEPARVFYAWLDPGIARQWLFATASHPIEHVEIDARAGGAFRFRDVRGGVNFDYAGRYVEVVPARRLVFTLVLPEADRVVTRVAVNIRAPKLGATLELVHENVPTDLADRVKGRWTGMLYGLRLLLAADRGRPESFDDRHCRFEVPPFDYKAEHRVSRPFRSER